MIDDSESNLIVKKQLEEIDAQCKEHEDLFRRFDLFWERLRIEEANRRDRLENSLFKRFIRWVRND